MTKAFTSLLLADMVERGEVALDDPVAACLSAEVHVPQRRIGKSLVRRRADNGVMCRCGKRELRGRAFVPRQTRIRSRGV